MRRDSYGGRLDDPYGNRRDDRRDDWRDGDRRDGDRRDDRREGDPREGRRDNDPYDYRGNDRYENRGDNRYNNRADGRAYNRSDDGYEERTIQDPYNNLGTQIEVQNPSGYPSGYPSSYAEVPIPGAERSKNCTGSGCCTPKCFAEKGSRVNPVFLLSFLFGDEFI